LTAETKYGGTVTNVKRRRVPGGGSSYSKTTRAKACADPWDRQQTTVVASLFCLQYYFTLQILAAR